MKIKRAMVMAAGKGTRMRPLTDTLPKPMVPFMGEALIDHVLDRLEKAGIEEVIVNVHHFADKLEAHLARRGFPPASSFPTSATACSIPAAARNMRCTFLARSPSSPSIPTASGSRVGAKT